MLSTNQRDILAGIMTAVYLYDGSGLTYEDWIETYEYYRERINLYLEANYENLS